MPTAPPPPVPTSATPSAPSSRSRRRAVVLGGLAAGVVAVAVAWSLAPPRADEAGGGEGFDPGRVTEAASVEISLGVLRDATAQARADDGAWPQDASQVAVERLREAVTLWTSSTTASDDPGEPCYQTALVLGRTWHQVADDAPRPGPCADVGYPDRLPGTFADPAGSGFVTITGGGAGTTTYDREGNPVPSVPPPPVPVPVAAVGSPEPGSFDEPDVCVAFMGGSGSLVGAAEAVDRATTTADRSAWEQRVRDVGEALATGGPESSADGFLRLADLWDGSSGGGKVTEDERAAAMDFLDPWWFRCSVVLGR